MKTLLVGGYWSDTIPTFSSIIEKMRKEFKSENNSNIISYNGGLIQDLNVVAKCRVPYFNLIIWSPNIDNKYIKEYPIKRKGAVLICTKVIRANDTNPTATALQRLFKMKANAVILIDKKYKEISGPEDTKPFYIFKLIDALGNCWYDGHGIPDLVDVIQAFYNWSNGQIRIPIKKTLSYKSCLCPANYQIFLDMVKILSKNIRQSDVGRFFGNCSTRCFATFPSLNRTTPLHFDSIWVSKRNVNKDYINIKDMVNINNYVMNSIYHGGEYKPSIDTPIQYLLYQTFPDLRYMIHGHAYIKDAPETNNYYPCGDIREVPELINIMRHDIKWGAINLKHHGFILYSKTLEKLQYLINNIEIIDVDRM